VDLACDQAEPLDLRPAPPDIATGPITYYGVFATGASSVYIVGENGTIMHSSDDGMTWSKGNPTAVTLYSVWGTSDIDVYTVGAGNHIYHTTDGANWTEQPSSLSGMPGALLSVSGAPPFRGDVWAVGTIGRILHSTGNGSWIDQTGQGTYDLSRALNAVTSAPGGVAAGESGITIWDNPPNWIASKNLNQSWTPFNLNALWSNGNGLIFAAGNAGTILESTDAGLHWFARAANTQTNLFGVSGSGAVSGNGGQLTVVGDNGLILRSLDGGMSWSPVASANTNALKAVSDSGLGDVYAVGANATVLHNP
jgi:photosystem II stability/assembly factor-like uncharacterized protein